MASDSQDRSVSARPGIVVIGRNEGERLARCLGSVRGSASCVVYADSGSGDGSADRARELGARVIELDSAQPFSAARGRNEGLELLLECAPDVELVQFIDGDCELASGWLSDASAWLEQNPEVAVVCGRVRERRREANPYHRLADMEWDVPAGEVDACGGIALFRVHWLRELGGFRTDLIAGEEPELCLRIRARGQRIVRLEREMCSHDADMQLFGQWWLRQTRAGHAYAEVAYLHGFAVDSEAGRALLSIAFWAFAVPAATLLGVASGHPAALAALLVYPMQLARIALHRRRQGARPDDATLYAGACLVGKFAQLAGAARFAWNRVVRRSASGLFEYKRTDAP